jgi:hypothetical protein
VDVVLRIAAQTCEGLVAAHAAGVVHRDIKPSNLFLAAPTASGRIIKILDFGIARVRGAGSEAGPTELTNTGAIIGSPLYMAPEQLRGAKTLDHRADVWSLGVVMYRLLCGAVPHEGATIADLLITVCSEPAPPLRERAPWVPEPVAELVHRALAIDVDARVPTMRAFADELRKLLPDGTTITDAMLVSQGPPVRASSTSPRRAAAAVSMARTAVAPAPREGVSRGLVWALVITAAAGAAFFIQRSLRTSTSPSDSPQPDPVAPRPPGKRPPGPVKAPGPKWFAKVRPRCTALELRTVLADTPAPHTLEGASYEIACAALAGDIALVRHMLDEQPAGSRAFAIGPTFQIAHDIADRVNNDPAVADIMRIVIDVWPDNYQALYAAGLVEFQTGDARAASHLRKFIELHPGDAFSQTAQDVLAVQASHDCKKMLRDPMGHAIATPGC